MNKHPHFTTSLSIRTLREAPKRQSYRLDGCALCITVITALYQPPGEFFWATRYSGTPQTRALHGLYASSECFGTQKGGRNKTNNQHSKLNLQGLPTGARRRYFISRLRPHVDNPPNDYMNDCQNSSVDSYESLSVDSKLPLCY